MTSNRDFQIPRTLTVEITRSVEIFFKFSTGREKCSVKKFSDGTSQRESSWYPEFYG